MRSIKIVGFLVILLSISPFVLVSPEGRAWAAGGGGGVWGGATAGQEGVSVGVGVKQGKKPTSQETTTTSGAPSPNSGGSGAPAPQIENVYLACSECLSIGTYCSRSGQLVNAGGPLAAWPLGGYEPYLQRIVFPNGKVPPQTEETFCPPPPAAETTTAPPPPPTSAQVLKTVPLPKLTLRFDPSTEGLTQLPTWFWVPNMDTNFEVGPVGVDGYAVTVSLHPVSYHWTFGDGASANSTKPGSGANAEAASVVHTYHETGTYRVGLTVSWAGSYTFTGNGAAQTTSLGPVQQAEVYRNYVVQQVRSVPLNP